MKKICTHVHSRYEKGITWPQMPAYTYPTPSELRPFFEKLNIERGVLLPGVSPEGRHYQVTNEEAIRIVKENPDLYDWFCGVDPRWAPNTADGDMSYFIRYYMAHGAKGVGEVTAKLSIDDPKMQNMFFHIEQCGLPLVFHLGTPESPYGMVDEVGLPRLEASLERFPKLIFIGHSQPFWAEISTDCTAENRNSYPKGKVTPGRVVTLLRRYPNLHADLSGGSGWNALSRDPGFAYDFLEEFQDRLYYATDIAQPKWSEFLSLGAWLDEADAQGYISHAAYVKICRNNALRLLGRENEREV